jgi:hypothetical protein
MERSEWTGLENGGEEDAERSVPGELAEAMEAAGREALQQRRPRRAEGPGLGDVLMPLQRLGGDDSVATALEGLRAPLPNPTDLLPRGGAARAAPRLISLPISGGTDFVFPGQYDWSWEWGPVGHVADVGAGYYRTVGSAGNVDGDPGPSRHGATGIGIRLRSPGNDARVRIRHSCNTTTTGR